MPAKSIPWRQQARGSAMAAASQGTVGSSLKAWDAGMQLYWAKPPSRVTPMASMEGHSCFLPFWQYAQWPQ